jgi:signal transduction histidine kinase
MNIFLIPPVIISVLFIILGSFVYFQNRKAVLNNLFTLLCLNSSIWLFSYSMGYGCKNELTAFLWLRIGYTGVIFITTYVFNYTVVFLNLKKLQLVVLLTYLLGFIWVTLLWFSPYLIKGISKYYWGYYPKAGVFHPLFLLFFIGLSMSTFTLLLYFFFFKRKNISLIRIEQIKYLFLAFFIYNFASVDFLPNYGIKIYPFGYIPAFIFTLLIGYTVVKYRLMDISVVITRTGVFIALYSLILGLPFLVGLGLQSNFIVLFGNKWWFVPMGLLTVLATVGPFIYIYINRKAEERLLREQRQYQNTLRQASSGMIRVRELKRLLNLIVHVVTKAVKLEFASIFLFDTGNDQYAMAAIRDGSNLPQNLVLKLNTPLIDMLHEKKEPIVYEEVQLQSQDSPHDSKMSSLEKQLKEIRAAVVIPSYVGNKLLGFIVLGKKLSGKIYSQDDLNVFSVLANQAALAIENAQFYEDIKETQEQLFQAEKMATVGTMADGLSHQINNRFQALSLISGDSIDILRTTDIANCSQDVKDAFGQLKYAFERIQANVMQGGEIVRGLLKYSRPGESGFEAIEFNKILDGALEMAQYKVRLNELDIVRNIPQDLPKLRCNLTQLEEIFFNLVDNAYDAIKERQVMLKDKDFKGKISISAKQEDGRVRIVFQDNGIGVKDKDKEKLFTPFFTTKSTNRKGTGLGLYVIQKIVSFHQGTVSINSVYSFGTTFEIALPLAK